MNKSFLGNKLYFLLDKLRKEKKKTRMTDKNLMGQYTPFPKYKFLPDSPTLTL